MIVVLTVCGPGRIVTISLRDDKVLSCCKRLHRYEEQ